MTQAYVKLANKSFHDENNGEKFETLEDVKNHLDSKIPTYQLFGCKYDSDDEDKGHGNYKNGDNKENFSNKLEQTYTSYNYEP
jgi:hypothetical protein